MFNCNQNAMKQYNIHYIKKKNERKMRAAPLVPKTKRTIICQSLELEQIIIEDDIYSYQHNPYNPTEKGKKHDSSSHL